VRTEPLERELIDPDALELTHERFHEAGIALPTVAQLADPELVPAGRRMPESARTTRIPSTTSGALAQGREPRRSGRRARAHRAVARADRRRREDRARARLVAEGPGRGVSR